MGMLSMEIGNRVTEKDIRNFLDRNGYFGRSAQFEELELHAIERPGWLQVFRFKVKAKSSSDGALVLLFGAVRDDERFKLNEIRIFENINLRDRTLFQWSEGLMKPKYTSSNQTTTNKQYFKELAIFVVVLAAIFSVLAIYGIR